jgi:hypothetical protein
MEGTMTADERRYYASHGPECRHSALLACAALRHHGEPARVRVGFADYFRPGFHDDHWITEHWDGGRWRLMDPELAAGARRHFGITFDPCDVG